MVKTLQNTSVTSHFNNKETHLNETDWNGESRPISNGPKQTKLKMEKPAKTNHD